MARFYRDMIPDEADGRLYVSLLNRDGTVALHDVAVEVSSPLLQQGDKFGAAAVNLLLELDDEGRPRLAIPPAAVGGLASYAHTKKDRVHTLTGSGANIRFVATADFAEGDTVTVNGAACEARTVAGDALWGGFWAKGAVGTAWLNEAGDALTFSGAGLSAADKAQLVPGNLLSGVSVNSGGVRVAGGIPRKGAAAYTPGTEDQVLAAGQYLEGAQTIKGDANLVAANIRSGVSIFGVTGTLERPVALIDAFSDGNNWDQVLARVTSLDDGLIATSSYSTSNGRAAAIPFKRSAIVRLYAANARTLMSASIKNGDQANVTAGSYLYIYFGGGSGSTAFLLTEIQGE